MILCQTRAAMRACIALIAFGGAMVVVGCSDADVGEADVTARGSALVLEDLGFPWTEVPVTITNVNSGKCFEVVGYGTSPGSVVQQSTCNSGTNQKWFISPTGTGTYQIRSGHVGNKIL